MRYRRVTEDVEQRLIDYLQAMFDACENDPSAIDVVTEVAEIIGFELEGKTKEIKKQ